jgi:hypothetical protein
MIIRGMIGLTIWETMKENQVRLKFKTGESHALPGNEKPRKSEQEKHGQWGKSTHSLETRRGEKVSKRKMGYGGMACTH